nr:SH3 domain-containing protein [uncultured Oscillibacter sp.]
MAKKKDPAAPAETAAPAEKIQSSGEVQDASQGEPEAPQTSQSPELEPQPPEPARAVVRAENGLNLRAGPGPGFEVWDVLPGGAEVSVLTLLAEGGPQGVFDFRVPGWSYIFTGKYVGWVDSRFLELPEAGHG